MPFRLPGYQFPSQPYSNRYTKSGSNRLWMPARVGLMPAFLDGGAASQIRSVGQRTAPSSNFAGSTLPYMCRIFETAPYDFDEFGIDFGLWAGSVETAQGGNLTITGASFEYPGGGVFTVLTFGGQTGITQAGGTDIVGDMVKLNRKILKGEKYFVRWLWQGSAQIAYTGNGSGGDQYVPGGDAIEQTATNKVTSGTVVDGGLGLAMYPTVLKARTSLRIPAVLGDSRETGVGEVANASGILGSVCQGISTYSGYLRLAISGEQGQVYQTNGLHRQKMQKAYTDFTISAFGINDIYGGGRTAPQVVTTQQALAAITPGKPYFITTLAPESSSTDSWATQGNQTVGAGNTVTEAYNALILSNNPGNGVTGVLDIRAAFEFGLTSGKWLTNGTNFAYTPDGVHPSRLANNGVIITAAQIGLP